VNVAIEDQYCNCCLYKFSVRFRAYGKTLYGLTNLKLILKKHTLEGENDQLTATNTSVLHSHSTGIGLGYTDMVS